MRSWRDRRRWVASAAVSMVLLVALGRLLDAQHRAPVGAASIGPLLVAIACSPAVVATFGIAAVLLRVGIDLTDPEVDSVASLMHAVAVTLLSTIAFFAATARERRERELATARPAHRLAGLATALGASRSVEDVQEAFIRTVHDVTDARWVRFVLTGNDHESLADRAPTYVGVLSVASGELGRVEIWYDEPPSDETLDVLEHAVAQTAVALSRAQGARTLATTARRLAALQRSTSRLAGLLRTDDIARAMVVEMRQALQGDVAVFCAADDGTPVRVLASDPDGHDAPRESVERVLSTDQLDVHEPSPADITDEQYRDDRPAAWITAPIEGLAGPIGAVHVAFHRAHRFDEEERRLVSALATLVGTAWRRAARFEAEEREREETERRADRAARLATLAATLAEARDRAAVAAAFTDLGLRAADASWGGLFELDEVRGVLRLLASRTHRDVWTPGVTVSLDSDSPLALAARERRIVAMPTRADVAAHHPDESLPPTQHARAAVPLLSYGRVIGVIGFAWDEERTFDLQEEELLRTIATRTSEALERALLHEAEREDERRWSLLAEASAVLSDALQPAGVVDSLLTWSVPLVSDWCAVHVIADDGSVRTRSAGSVDAEWTGPAAVDRALRPDRTEAPTEQVIVAPLVARGQRLGALVVGLASGGREFSASDVDLVADLASRFAIVYDNAVLYATERNLGARLQTALLPAHITPPPGVSVAVRYRASGSRAGGDWYDLIPLAGGSAALVVGDLVGHGIEAAATMSRYRSALRAHARMFSDPADVMNAYSTFIRVDEEEQTATVLYCRLDVGARTLSYCSAGHPPAIVHDGSRSIVLPSPQGPLIGLTCGGYRTETVALPENALVVLYTDGLIERRRELLDAGVRRLQTAIEAAPADDLESFADELLARMHHDDHDDDVVVLAARLS